MNFIDVLYDKIYQSLKTQSYKNSGLYNTYKTYQCTIYEGFITAKFSSYVYICCSTKLKQAATFMLHF